MKFLSKYNEEQLPDGHSLDLLKAELDEAVETEEYERAQEIKNLMDVLISDNEEYKKKYGLGEHWYSQIINNVNENINTRNFTLSRSEFYQYGDQVKKILNHIYAPQEWITITSGGGSVKVLKALESEKDQGRDYSVLNKVNTNIKLINTLVSKFKIQSFIDLIKFIRSEREKLFIDGGQYFHIIYDTIRSTEAIGERNEDKVVDYIRDLIQKKFNITTNPHREVTSSYKDMVLGIDITFNVGGKDYTVQVKPLKAYNEIGDKIKVQSSGNIKKYDTDYIAFVGNTILMFQNKDVKISGNFLEIPSIKLVKND